MPKQPVVQPVEDKKVTISEPEPEPVAPMVQHTAPISDPTPAPEPVREPAAAPAQTMTDTTTLVEVPVQIKPELAKLFEVSQGDDLADQFLSQRITSIQDEMGINERILTINELFGGDPEKFNTVVEKLNAMPDLARPLLSWQTVRPQNFNGWTMTD